MTGYSRNNTEFTKYTLETMLTIFIIFEHVFLLFFTMHMWEDIYVKVCALSGTEVPRTGSCQVWALTTRLWSSVKTASTLNK